MGELTHHILAVILEFLGSGMLGIAQSVLRQRVFGYIFFPFFAWAAYASCYRVTGGHLNPILSVAAIIRPDKQPNFNVWRTLFYIPAQWAGFMCGVVCQWWYDQYAGQLRFKLQRANNDDYYWSEGTWIELWAAAAFVFLWLTQTGSSTTVSKDPGFQTFAIGTAYGVLVYYSAEWAGGSLNPAYAFAQNFWDEMDDGEEEAFQFFGLYVGCTFAGMAAALIVHSLLGIKAHDESRFEEQELAPVYAAAAH